MLNKIKTIKELTDVLATTDLWDGRPASVTAAADIDECAEWVFTLGCSVTDQSEELTVWVDSDSEVADIEITGSYGDIDSFDYVQDVEDISELDMWLFEESGLVSDFFGDRIRYNEPSY